VRIFSKSRRLTEGTRRNSPLPWLTIVGVIADVRHPNRLELSEVPLDIYLPLAQQSVALGWRPDEARMRSFGLIARTNGDPHTLKLALPREIWALDAEQPIQLDRHVRTMQESVRLESFEKRALAWLLSAFALTALGLAALGLYGLLSRYVSERTHEIGIRTALGAQALDVLRLMIWQGMKLTLLGMALGVALARALTRWLASLLYEVKTTDPLTFVLIALLLTVVALLACWLPARRATQVDPMIALRHD
jgi:putative ABC transport system permease protein